MFMFPSSPTAPQENPIKLGMGRRCPVGYLNKGFLEELPLFPLLNHLLDGCRLELSAKWETSMVMLVSNSGWSSPVWLLGSSNVEDRRANEWKAGSSRLPMLLLTADQTISCHSTTFPRMAHLIIQTPEGSLSWRRAPKVYIINKV